MNDVHSRPVTTLYIGAAVLLHFAPRRMRYTSGGNPAASR